MENVGKRTPPDPMEMGCCGKSPLDCSESVRKTRIEAGGYELVCIGNRSVRKTIED